MADDRELTEKQQEFALAYVSATGCIGNAEAAAIAAGYSAKTARVQGHQLLSKPHVQAAIRTACFELISVEVPAEAIFVIRKIMNDEKAGNAVRLDAAKTLLDRGGYSAIRAPQAVIDGILQKDLSEMTPGELEATIAEARLAREAIGARMRQIEHSGIPTIEGQAAEVDGDEGES